MLSEEALAYRRWICERDIEGCSIKEMDGDGLTIDSDVATGVVNFYDIDGTTVVELRLEGKRDSSPLFFLHFELEDMERAHSLFEEMMDVLRAKLNSKTHHVLLCCTCGMTTTFFANKLNELATDRDLGYDFCAKSIEEAKRSGLTYEAVLLAPQVGHQLKAVQEALPGVMVMELPASVFGAYDANAALRLLLEGLRDARSAAMTDLRFARDFDMTKSVLSVSYVFRSDEPTISYLVLEKGEERLRGMLVRRTFDIEAPLKDLFSTLRLHGYSPRSFDAIGIAVPGIVDDGRVALGEGDESHLVDIAAKLTERWGVPVFVDNNASAAAAGCYISQNEWDSVVFHAQPVGVTECDQGYVVDGRPHTGRGGFSGNIRHLAKRLTLSMGLEEAAWRYDGMRDLVACYLAAVICTVAPEAIFVWCDLVPDMDELGESIAEIVPAEAVPELVGVSDYDGLTLMGEQCLCLQRLVEA